MADNVYKQMMVSLCTDLVALWISGDQTDDTSGVVHRRLDALVQRHTMHGLLVKQLLVNLQRSKDIMIQPWTVTVA